MPTFETGEIRCGGASAPSVPLDMVTLVPYTPITDWRNTETIVKNVDHSRNKRIEEAQLFYVAASRAAGRVGLFSVEDTDTTPSVFVHLVKEDVDTQAVEVGDVPVTGLAGMVARLRVEGLESNPNEKERGGQCR